MKPNRENHPSNRTKIHHLIAFIIAMMLLHSISGCSVLLNREPAETPTPSHPVPIDVEMETVTFHMESEFLPKEPFLSAMVSNVNTVLTERGVSARIEINTMPRTNYSALPVVDDIDVVRINSIEAYKKLHEEGSILDISVELEERPGLYAQNPSSIWKHITQNDRVFAFPLFRDAMFNGIPETSFLMRDDVLNELGVSDPTSWEELITISELARENGLDYKIAYPVDYPPYQLHRTYEEWPFYVDEMNLALYHQDGRVNSYPHSDIYQLDVAVLNATKDKGLLDFVLDIEEFRRSGDDFLAVMYPITQLPTTSPCYDKVRYVQLAPEKPTFPMGNEYTSLLCIPSTVEAERLPIIMDVIEAIYTDQDVFDAFVYGVKGENYTLNDDGTLSDGSTTFLRLYTHGKMARLNEHVQSIYPDMSSMHFIDFSEAHFEPVFAKDTMPVLNELYKSNGLLRMRAGLYDTSSMPTCLKALNEKGIMDIVEYYQEQLDSFLK